MTSTARTMVIKSSFLHILAGSALFLTARDLSWAGAWIYLAVTAGFGWLALAVLNRVSPDLLEERNRFRHDAKGFDKVLAPMVLFIPTMLALLAGFDQRYGWSASRNWRGVAAGSVLMLASASFILWAMLSNPFFSAMVRIQRDRGHRVVSGGPYQWVRHPGYTGILVLWCAIPLVLGSGIAWLGVAGGAIVLIVRTALEDRVLAGELEGYQEYASAVRYRLIPGVW